MLKGQTTSQPHCSNEIPRKVLIIYRLKIRVTTLNGVNFERNKTKSPSSDDLIGKAYRMSTAPIYGGVKCPMT